MYSIKNMKEGSLDVWTNQLQKFIKLLNENCGANSRLLPYLPDFAQAIVGIDSSTSLNDLSS